MNDARNIVKPALVLLIVCFVTSFLLAFVNASTRDVIKARAEADAVEQRKQVMSAADSFKEITGWQEKDKSGIIDGVWAAYAGQDLVGYVFSTTSKGYGGDMIITVGISKNLEITSVKLGDNSETPGLGTKAGEESFIGQFNGKSAKSDFVVVKSVPASDNEIQAVSGATISSKAVTSSVQAAADMAEILSENGGVIK